MTENWLSEEELKVRYTALEENYKIVRECVEKAAVKSGRKPNDITLLAATKTVPVQVINRAIGLGITCIGENKVQELCEKYDYLHLENCDCQFIGHLQTNKVKQLIGKVSMIQSVDSVRLAQEISKISEQRGCVTSVLVEVNVGKEESKSGIYLEEVESFLVEISTLSGIKVRGLMTIPPAHDNISKTMRHFENMYQKSVDIRSKKLDNISIDYLSMGMSADYVQAIEAGANMVRVGSALFGQRVY